MGTVSTTSVPILSKLERVLIITCAWPEYSSVIKVRVCESPPWLRVNQGTAPRTARSHDVSHLCDQPMHLTPSIPMSLIEEKDHASWCSRLQSFPSDKTGFIDSCFGFKYGLGPFRV